MPGDSNEKTFWGHLDDLRKVLFKMVAVLALFTAVLFVYMPEIFDRVIFGPCHGDFVLYRLFARITDGIPMLPQFSTEGFEVKIINTRLASQFFTHISTSFWLALVCSCPFMLYFLWSFISPALYDREKRGARTAFLQHTAWRFGNARCIITRPTMKRNTFRSYCSKSTNINKIAIFAPRSKRT